MNNEGESGIRELFRRLRVEDEVLAPSLEQTLAARRRSQGFAGAWSFQLKLAVSLLVLVVLMVPVLVHLDRDPVDSEEQLAVDVLEWESPTDFLLTYSEGSLMTTVPRIEMQIPLWAEEGALESFGIDGEADGS